MAINRAGQEWPEGTAHTVTQQCSFQGCRNVASAICRYCLAPLCRHAHLAKHERICWKKKQRKG